MRLREWLWLACLLSLGVAALWISHEWLAAPVLTNDSYQYLDAAASVASGECLCTRLAHFDEQVAAGRMPIAFTHFPPGYPLLIAGLSRLRMSLETASYVISAIAFLLTIWLIWDTGLALGGTQLMSSLSAALWIANHGAILYASAVLTESVFMMVFAAVVALVIGDVMTHGSKPARLVGIGGLARRRASPA